MNTSKFNSLLFALVVAASSLFGQQGTSENTLSLRSGKLSLPSNTDSYFAQRTSTSNQDYRYLQFHKIPDANQLKELQGAGIHCLQYLSNRTYITSIHTDQKLPRHLEDNIRSVVQIKATDKIAPKLLTLVEEETTFDEKRNITFLLQHYPDFPSDQFMDLLRKQNINIIEEQISIQAITISTTKNQLLEIANWPMVANLETVSANIQPEDEFGQSHHRSNLLNSNWDAQMHFNGEGVHIAIGDDGYIGPHIDLSNRIEQADLIGDQSGTHGEMVAGILSGAGNIDPANNGIATGATLHVLRDFEAVKKANILFEEKGVVITNTAYSDGCNRGYTSLAQLADQQSFLNPALIHVFSGGNAGIDDCEYGAGNGWGNITGGVKVGKNVLAVANLNMQGERVSSSSRGPSNDGRIKPDIAAFGEGQIGLSPNNEYQVGSGTSAAAPVISGILAQLYQAYREQHNNINPPSALIKAALLNSAEDLGNIGPDYSFGWGKVNAFKAFQILDEENWISGTAIQDSEENFSIDIPEAVKELRVMIYWHDQAASPTSTKSLVADIDLTVTDVNNVNHLPWLLNNNPDATLLDLPATKGADHLNNVEQVVIENPTSGTYQINVTGFEIPFSQQDYYIVYQNTFDELKLSYPNGGESFAPNDMVQIHWDAFGIDGNFELAYSSDDGNTWVPIASVAGNLRQYIWTVPDLVSGAMRLRVTRGNLDAMSTQVFSIFDTPQNLALEQICPEYVRLSWDALEDAQNYTLYQLGDHYMDSVAITTNTSIEFPIANPMLQYWFAISAQSSNSSKSKRSIAIPTSNDLINCTPAQDMALLAITNPATHVFSDCFNQSIPVSINIKNTGSELQNDIPIYYQFNNEPVVPAFLNGTLPPTVTVNYTFDVPISTSGIGEQRLKVWTGLLSDEAAYNDTLSFSFEITESTINALPFFENFDNFELCTSESNCAVNCLLENDWRNTSNTIDHIDWRVHRGKTPTFGTGPTSDQNTGINLGQYLYLEAGAGCFQQNAILTSPCIDLNNAITPTLTFWYHLFGTDMGSLNIDLFDGTQWHFNISNAIVSNQGNQWQQAKVDLQAFANQLVTLRFRGKTGDGFSTDIAIDNIAVFDANTPPIADFRVDKRLGCSDEVIHFTDNSFNEGTEWIWTFDPPTVGFLQNTDAQSQHPIVRFEETGIYTVSLFTMNDYGDSEILKTDYITISDGVALPYSENFDGAIFPPVDWESENNDNDIGWLSSEVVGKNGQYNQSAFMNNFSYNRNNEEDALRSPIIDLSNTTNPLLRFDYAYVSYSSNFADQLTVTLSNDCGNIFDIPLFEKSGSELATAQNQNKAWVPKASVDWETAIIDLSDYVGQSVALRFLNTCQFGNNLYLDNVVVYEEGDFPVATFEMEEATICLGEMLTINNTSIDDSDLNFFWEFGSNNMPPDAETKDAPAVTFLQTGLQAITLMATNDLGTDVSTQYLQVIDEPVISFSTQHNGSEIQFTDQSLYGISYLWDFGDGQTSNEENPTHDYATIGLYEVRLEVSNDCGTSEYSEFIDISSSTHQPDLSFELSILPNPATDWFIIKTNNAFPTDLHYRILSVSGKLFSEGDLFIPSGIQLKELDISTLPSGIYFLHFESNGFFISRRLVVI